MKKLNIRKLLFYALLLSMGFLLLLFMTLPKFLLFDRELQKRGIYLTAESVKEGLTELSLTGVSLYDQRSKIARFDRLELSLGFFRLRFVGLCEGKSLMLEWSFRSIRLRTDDFACLSHLDGLSADLTVQEGIYGKVKIRGINLQGIKTEELSLELRGRVFSARVKHMGFELLGDGQMVFKPSDPLRSGINAQLSGGGIKLTLSGTLEKPQLLQR